jgi:hypothetical protein
MHLYYKLVAFSVRGTHRLAPERESDHKADNTLRRTLSASRESSFKIIISHLRLRVLFYNPPHYPSISSEWRFWQWKVHTCVYVCMCKCGGFQLRRHRLKSASRFFGCGNYFCTRISRRGVVIILIFQFHLVIIWGSPSTVK